METLYIFFLFSVIVFCISNLYYLLTFKPHKIEYIEEHPYPGPYEPPNEVKVVRPRGKDLPIIKEGNWVYDPNVHYRPRSRQTKK